MKLPDNAPSLERSQRGVEGFLSSGKERKPHFSQDTKATLGAWQSVYGLVTSPWWTRVWVYQEFLSVTNVTFLVGDFSAPWTEVYHFLGPFFREREQHVADCRKALERLRRYADASQSYRAKVWSFVVRIRTQIVEAQVIYNKQLALLTHSSAWNLCEDVFRSKAARGGHVPIGEMTRLSTLLSHSRQCLSSKPRDKAYAVLGLADSTVGYELPIDYSAHTTDTDVLIRLAKTIFLCEQSLDTLSMPSARDWPWEDSRDSAQSRHRYLPSWATDWFTPLEEFSTQDRFQFKSWQRKLPIYRNDCSMTPHWGKASGNIPAQITFLPDGDGNPDRVLGVRGLFVATLGHVLGDSRAIGWSRFASHYMNKRTGLVVETTSEARRNCEVWVIFGADKPLTLRRSRRGENRRRVLGPALLKSRGDGMNSDIHTGSLAELYRNGMMQAEDIWLI